MSILKAVTAENEAKNAPFRVPLPPETQRVCIDLPGEHIRCIAHKPNLQIVLRKHIDVVFDIKLFKGMQYTVEADQNDFYNARDKKLVEFKKKQLVTFKDGERLHLHVGRNFTGNLTLKAAGKVMGRWSPSELDANRYDDAPETKLAPLMVVMKNDEGATPATASANTHNSPDDPLGLSKSWKLSAITKAYLEEPTPLGRPTVTHAAHEPLHPTVAVVDVDAKSVPAKFAQHFAHGGGKSGLMEIDTNDVMTRNWLYGQLTGAAAYAKDNWSWLRNSINKTADGSFKLVSAKISYATGKARVYFTGYSKMNPVFGPGGHGSGNAKILQIYAGVGSSASSFKAATMSIAGTLKANALISFIFGAATSYAEWQEDAAKDGYDLAAAWITGLIKTLVTAAIVAILVAAFVFAVIAGAKIALGALIIGGLTIGLGFVVGYGVEAVDKRIGRGVSGDPKNTDGSAYFVAPWLRDVGKAISENWDYLKSKMPIDYKDLSFSK
jgi:hypothetical protein